MDKYVTLNNKKRMPNVGLGTWRSDKNKVGQAVEYAILEAGYRHVDCASVYGNEKEIGEAFGKIFKDGKVKREEVFVTSKLWNTEHNPQRVEAACRKTLEDLKLEYLDLYLIHWGIAFEHGEDIEPVDENGMVRRENVPVIETWKAMEKLVEKGWVKSIGVANFTAPMLVDLLTYSKVKPAMNQIEVHPYNSQTALIDFCRKIDIAVTAYSPLGSSGTQKDKPLGNPIILKIAKAYGKTPAQVLVRWLIDRGLVTIPKSVTPERILENMDVFDFQLSPSDMAEIGSLNRDYRYVDPVVWWGVPYFK